VSAWQFLQPGVLVAAAIGVFSVTAYNPLSALLKQRASEIDAKTFAKSLKASAPKPLWIRQKSLDGAAVIRAEAAVENTTNLSRVAVFTFDAKGSVEEQIEARAASLHEGYWELTDARVLSPDSEPQTYGSYLLASNLDAAQVRQSFTPAESVPFWQLPETISRAERAGLDATRYRLHYDVLMARPLLFIAMVFVAASVSLRFFRFGGIGPMVLAGVASGFALYVATQLMENLGSAGFVAPAVAAWFPAVVGSLLGTLALLYQEDG
jgi:lipopolysaccharide export system permease protein